MPSDGGPRSTMPAFYLYVVDKDNTKAKTRAGAVFQDQFGGYHIRLHPGVSISWNDEVYLNLVPYEDKDAYRRRMQARDKEEQKTPAMTEDDGSRDDDDDIAF